MEIRRLHLTTFLLLILLSCGGQDIESVNDQPEANFELDTSDLYEDVLEDAYLEQNVDKILEDPHLALSIDPMHYGSTNGDVNVSLNELHFYYDLIRNNIVVQPHHLMSAISLVNLNGNAFFSNPKKIYYAVKRSSYPTAKEYDKAVDEFEQACWDWKQICGVKFIHRTEFDKGIKEEVPKEVFFILTKSKNPDGLKMAEAFYPFCYHSNHIITTFPKFDLEDSAKRVAIYEHELGHVLGFTHEQSVSGKECAADGSTASGNSPAADRYWAITPYDSLSIMHYKCDSGSPDNLDFSEQDRRGALAIFPK